MRYKLPTKMMSDLKSQLEILEMFRKDDVEGLKGCGVIRSSISSCRAKQALGDYAEFLVASKLLTAQLMGRNHPGFDLLCPQLGRVQVKARMFRDGERQPRFMYVKNLDLRPFDHLVLMIFGTNWAVIEARILSFVEASEAVDKHYSNKNSSRFYVKKEALWHSRGIAMDIADFQLDNRGGISQSVTG